MKRLILILVCLVFVNGWVFGEDEIVIPDEQLPTINTAKIDTITIHRFTNTMKVLLRKGFIQKGNFVATGYIGLNFMDIKDDPSTEEDETSTKYTEATTKLLEGKSAFRTFIREKLGE